jgi:hypothetical protein
VLACDLEKLRMFESLAARDSLVQAVAKEPSFPLAHAALPQVWSTLGYDARAKEEAKRAYDLASDLPPEQRVMAEGRPTPRPRWVSCARALLHLPATRASILSRRA